jgi:hypothetical protein
MICRYTEKSNSRLDDSQVDPAQFSESDVTYPGRPYFLRCKSLPIEQSMGKGNEESAEAILGGRKRAGINIQKVSREPLKG